MSRRIRVSLALLRLILLITFVAQAQTPLKVERSKVFARAGFVIPFRQQFSIGKGIGLVGELPVNRTGTQTLRLHFNASSQAPTWTIRIVEDSPTRRLLWSFSSSEEEHSDFWSDELHSNAVRVEVHSTQENNPLLLSIDRIIVDGSQAAPQAITPPNDLEKWGQQSAQRKAWGKSVARIRFVSDDDGESYFCTGFLVSRDVLMTNHHCIKTQREARSAHVDFDYDFEFAVPETIRGKELLLPTPPVWLDLALIRLRKPVDATTRTPFKLVSDLPKPGQQLLIIQHPGGEPKQISVTGCVVKSIAIKGLAESLADFGHGCDTKAGSSGAVVLNVEGGAIGLHHLGFREDDPDPDRPELVNQAVLMKEIIGFLRKNRVTELNAVLGNQ